jgi:DNA-binding NarL/FixJ family response regulator
MGAWKGSLTPGAGVSFQVTVDDNESIRELLRAFVETNTPFKVCGEAENGAEAIKMAKKLRPDLVLLDLTMPGMSGTDTAWLLQVVQPRPKIILFTIHADGLNHELGSIYASMLCSRRPTASARS